MVAVLFWIVAFFAEVIGTMAGFGSSTIFLPIALFFFDFRTALVLVAIFHISGLNKRILLIFGIPSIILTVIGALLVNYISQNILKFILGLFLLVYVIISSSLFDFSLSITSCKCGSNFFPKHSIDFNPSFSNKPYNCEYTSSIPFTNFS